MSAEAKTGEPVAAFFDLDGTLIPEPSLEQRFFSKLRRSGAIPFSNHFRWGVEALRLLPKGLLAVQHHNKRYLAGVCGDLVFRHMESISFFEEGIARVAWHARQGHEIVLVSGTLEPLARLAAMALECELEARDALVRPRVLATRLVEERGRWTGRLGGEVIYGPAKARIVENLAKEANLVLRHSHAYGNSLLDRQLLCAVGHGHAVNPGKDLADLANEKDWPIWHWHLEKKLDSKPNARLEAGITQVEEQA
jgi:HAD superfamily phosphoserine phosphatase-like hydrolase